MVTSVPPKLAELARELRLGEFQDRFGYRPGTLGGVALALVTGGLIVLFAEIATAGLLGLVFGEGRVPVDGWTFVPLLVVAALVAWRVRRVFLRFRGGLYLFDGGLAEAYGDRVVKIFTWSELREIRRHRSTVTLSPVLPLPVVHEDEYLIMAYREDVGAPDGLLLSRRLIGVRRAVTIIAGRIGQESVS